METIIVGMAISVIFIAAVVFMLSLFIPPTAPEINGIMVCPGQRYKIAGIDGVVIVTVIGADSVYYTPAGSGMSYSVKHSVFTKCATLVSAT